MLLKAIKIAFLLAIVVILLLSTWFSIEFYLAPKGVSETLVFEVEKGEKVTNIAQGLKERRIIRKKWPFLLGYRLFFSHKSLKAGEYQFFLPLSPKEALNTLIDGKVTLHPLTIPEGLTRKETSEHLESLSFVEREDFLAASVKTDGISSWDKEALDLEGYLFPETYYVPKGTPADKIIETMLSQFKKSFKEEWILKAAQLGMSMREVVILASLIEKETSIPEERGLVSSVFHNRLKIGMKLDCDPTIIYALKQEGRFNGRLRTKDLKLESPYNTYLHAGLPPGPICNPGKESLEAALYPAENKYLYFVSRNDGSHHFSSTLKEHLRAVRKYQK